MPESACLGPSNAASGSSAAEVASVTRAIPMLPGKPSSSPHGSISGGYNRIYADPAYLIQNRIGRCICRAAARNVLHCCETSTLLVFIFIFLLVAMLWKGRGCWNEPKVICNILSDYSPSKVNLSVNVCCHIRSLSILNPLDSTPVNQQRMLQLECTFGS